MAVPSDERMRWSRLRRVWSAAAGRCPFADASASDTAGQAERFNAHSSDVVRLVVWEAPVLGISAGPLPVAVVILLGASVRRAARFRN
jgi:hypothetical protein